MFFQEISFIHIPKWSTCKGVQSNTNLFRRVLLWSGRNLFQDTKQFQQTFFKRLIESRKFCLESSCVDLTCLVVADFLLLNYFLIYFTCGFDIRDCWWPIIVVKGFTRDSLFVCESFELLEDWQSVILFVLFFYV